MKPTTYLYIAAAVTVGCLMSSCDDISENDRFIPLPAVEAQKVVLLEEFTGQNCINCPKAHETVTGLLAQYPDNLISVSIHAGPLAYSETELPGIGLANSESETLFGNYSIASVPAGVIDRTSGVLNHDQWAAKIRAQLEKATDIDIDASAVLSPDAKSIDLSYSIEAYSQYHTTLELWILESGIKTMQVTPDGVKMDYEHNHVFRTAANGIKGESLQLSPRQPVSVTHTVAVKEGWAVENLDVIAIISDKSGVLQVCKTPVSIPQ